MPIADWKRLYDGDTSVLQGGHIGDFKQALKYFMGKSTDSKVMVEFTLKESGEKKLFSTTLALPKKSERSEKLKKMATAMGGESGVFPEASTDQGTSSEAIGVKSESEGEAGFSMGIGGGKTPKDFMALVESVALKSVGKNFSHEADSPQAISRIQADAFLLVGVNNCLISAISLGALNRLATFPELIAIRSAMNNYGEMLLASPEVVALIRQHLNITVPITVHYEGLIPDEVFDGVGVSIDIYHVNGNHFTHHVPTE
jgi:hypothetical protein